ncbi:hypothetical protein Q5741_07855 [Paenibacillus sp. JX-17]|uniref:AraC family transcriptional regulator n=1 Tax=Paenibacillus lacisoli TaxID=3064525 RepID=A0ABT9CAQ9_9BACL|nr:hypothetical protein [Paenibacillus sp. JX-17]MDO7906331.1 hypothetical protein [Paenibacillus sp. JX-17]
MYSYGEDDLELVIQYDDLLHGDSLQRGLDMLWKSRILVGPWPAKSLDSDEQDHPYTYGMLQLPGGAWIGCRAYAESGAQHDQRLVLCIPSVLLKEAYLLLGGTSVSRHEAPQVLKQVMEEIARLLYETMPFRLAYIGIGASRRRGPDSMEIEPIDICGQMC